MASSGIDSDDLLSDQGDYTETNVLLGYASKEPTEDTISHLGGHPAFLSPKQPPPGSYSTCKVCSSHLSLLLQLNGDLPERFPDNERRLYLFGCRKKQCMRKAGSVRGYRETRRWRNTQVKTGKTGPKKESIQTSSPTPASNAHLDPSWRGGSTTPDMLPLARGGNMGDLIFNSSGPFGRPIGNAENANPFSLNGANDTTASNPFGSSSILPVVTDKAQTSQDQPFNPGTTTDPPLDSVPSSSVLSAKLPQSPSMTSSPEQQTRSNTTAQTESSSSPFPETFASKLKLSSHSTTNSSTPVPHSPPQQDLTPWPPLTSFPPPYPLHHLDADYETLNPPSAPHPSSSLSSSAIPSTSKYDSEDTTTSSATTDKASLLDSDSTMDTTFQRFSDRLAQNPEQVLRYEFAGQPLLYSGSDAVASRFPASNVVTTSASGAKTKAQTKMPNCESCGARRVFELQLVPGAIQALEEEEGGEGGGGEMRGIEEGMEWGTVILGVCKRDCGAERSVGVAAAATGEAGGDGGSAPHGWREEWVGVQWEERVVRK